MNLTRHKPNFANEPRRRTLTALLAAIGVQVDPGEEPSADHISRAHRLFRAARGTSVLVNNLWNSIKKHRCVCGGVKLRAKSESCGVVCGMNQRVKSPRRFQSTPNHCLIGTLALMLLLPMLCTAAAIKLPHMPKRHKVSTDIKGAAAMSMMASTRTAFFTLPPQPVVHLVWNYPGDMKRISFIVWASTNLVNWQVVTNTRWCHYAALTKPCEFYKLVMFDDLRGMAETFAPNSPFYKPFAP